MSLSVSADELRKRSPKLIYINNEIEIMILKIDQLIKNAAAVDECEIKYEPKVLFDILGLTNIDCQALIFGKIIKLLKEKGFITELEGYGDNLVFIISWHLDCSSNEVKNSKKLIYQHTKKMVNSKEQQAKLIRQKNIHMQRQKIAYSKKIRELQEMHRS